MDPFTIFAAVAAIFGAVEGSKSASAARKSQQAQRDQQNLRAAQERRQSIRNMRMAYATAQQNQENQGVAGGSAQGGLGSIITQGNANLSFLDDQMLAANKAGMYADKAAKHEATSNMWGSLSKLSMIGKDMFSPPQPSATVPAPQTPPPQQVNTGNLFPYLQSQGWTNR